MTTTAQLPATNGTPTNGLPANLTGEELAAWLRIPHDDRHLQHLRRREGLPFVCFQINGDRHYSYPSRKVLTWTEERAGRARSKKC